MTTSPRIWQPTALGRKATKSTDWSAEVAGDTLRLTGDGLGDVAITDVRRVTVKRWLFWSTVELHVLRQPLVLHGMSRGAAKSLKRAIDVEAERLAEQVRVAALAVRFASESRELAAWAREFFRAAKAHQAAKGWLTREFTLQWHAWKPAPAFAELLAEPALHALINDQAGDVLEAIDLWSGDLLSYVSKWNDKYLESELLEHHDFFQLVEKQPLTDEQARAVVCFDNRVQVIAAAGSGKTSTMVAKAGYALRRQIVAPEKILLLAFNKDAAAELKARIRDRLLPLGLQADRVAAQTFHAFGLEIIGRATGTKPSLAPWLERGQDVDQVMRIVDELRDSSASFRASWDLFRVVLNRDLPEFGEEENDPEDWDAATKATGFRTLRGELVRSQGERLIADWLYFNGVSYEYERSYQHPVADETHSQYRPDFYYPDIDVYHEHFALDENGQPPTEFAGYAEGVAWKRATHAQYGTSLVETTMAQIWNGSAFAQLAATLQSRGIVLDPNPDRPVAGYRSIDNDQLVRTFRSFLTHAKSNRLDDAELQSRLAASPDRFRFRHTIFLALFAAVRTEWERKLADTGQIDFEDMLNQAADHLENGDWVSPFELVMVDELQDASPARARLVRALVNEEGRYLFGVGDDWQSINRFAGADLSVMTDFQGWFGPGETLRLERTFRAPQSICDVSSRFVQKNPAQLEKRVTSSGQEFAPSIRGYAARSEDKLGGAVSDHLSNLNDRVRTGAVAAARNGKVSVFVLGRYRNDVRYVPSRQWSHLDVSFHTIHGSKGLEADYVVMPRMVKGSYGFPSKTQDDPVLALAMPAREPFRFAEERRLFYVALTRARRAVALFTIENRVSPFLVELVQDHGITVERLSGVAEEVVTCAVCKRGTMVLRNGKFGAFHGCSEYPNCKNTAKITSSQPR